MATIKFWGGLGDEIAITGLVRELVLRAPDETVRVEGVRYPEVFKYNPRIGHGTQDSGRVIALSPAPHDFIGNLVHAYCHFAGLQTAASGESEIYFTVAELDAARALLDADERPIAAIDTWAFWPSKRWAFSRFAALTTALQERGYRVIELGATYPDVTRAKRTDRLPIDGKDCLLDLLTVRETAAVLAQCALFVGNNSGLAHLAAAVFVPTVLLNARAPWYARASRWTFPAFTLQTSCDACDKVCTIAPTESCLGALTVLDVLRVIEQIPPLFLHGQPQRMAIAS